jgi:hypothetical protein
LRQGEAAANRVSLQAARFSPCFVWKLCVINLVMGRIKHLATLSLLLGADVFFNQSQGAPVGFTIDGSKSFILVSGLVVNFAMTPQGAGALVTIYSGDINADLSGSGIQFTGGSTINAKTNGMWFPAVGGGTVVSAPADYGPEAGVIIPPFPETKLYGALRNISFDVTSPVLPITGTNFNGVNLVFSFASANAALDYYASSSLHGSLALSGYATNTVAVGSSVATNGSIRTLVIPIDAQFVFTLLSAKDTTVHLTGQIVATNVIAAAAPVIQSIGVINQNVVVTAENATLQSQLLISTNLAAWLPASFTTTTNNSGGIIFNTPMSGSHAFFRVQQ